MPRLGSPLTDRQLWEVAERWAKDARVSARHGGSPEAIYLAAGLALECALKAIAMRRDGLATFPARRDRRDFYSHDLRKLIGLAGVKADIDAAKGGGVPVADHWMIALNWRIEKRYGLGMDDDEARSMLECVVEPHTGLFGWLASRFRTIA